ncbi:MAG: hypothetical protein JWN24_1761 [Phycisphaerales bacterium]|nr:hypothetical protein [Phycisphaerales bacterium]
MGGDWIPESFIAGGSELWALVTKIIAEDDFYRMVAIARDGGDKLAVLDGNEPFTVPFRDDLIELFQALKVAGENSVFIADRMLRTVWIAPRDFAEPFLDHYVAIDDMDG